MSEQEPTNPAQNIEEADEAYLRIHRDEHGRVAQIDQYVPEVPKGAVHTGINLLDVTGTGDLDISRAKVEINQHVDEVAGRKSAQFKLVGTLEDISDKDSDHRAVINQRVGRLTGTCSGNHAWTQKYKGCG